MSDTDADDAWTCGKPGCDLGIDGHNFALAIEHACGLDEADAKGVADRTLDKVANHFGVAPEEYR